MAKQMVYPYSGTCCICGSYSKDQDYFSIHADGNVISFCRGCFRELHKQAGQALNSDAFLMMVENGDKIWELVYCDDRQWHVFPMIVKSVSKFGSVRWVKGKEPVTWNIYAEGDRTYTYKNFYDYGKTLFFTEAEAMKALEEKLKEAQ